VDELVLVVGAGPAGLAAAGMLRRAGVDPLVVDAADAVAAAWRQRHDHLRLNTHRMFSGNMHIHRRQARQLAQAITSHAGPRRA
jgi:cation diffusion facilitator CzcD-associated flavoprotein CzcO